MTDIEHPESFYLGREYDLERKKVLAGPVLYNSRDLTTHGVVVGMTGSGKTGLCISLLEEAALKGIPCVIVDLKGDLSNLLLNFPEMRPEDFEPWIDPDEARRKNISVEQYARERAETWRRGLKEWGESPERVRRLREAAEWRIYTPGSEAGLPVSVIQNFTAPAPGIDRETLNERVEATTTALLGLTNISSDPVQSREHILIANLLLHAWANGRDLDLPHLISAVTEPPLRKIGTFDIDMFYPEQERLQLALALNNLLASPSFSAWIEGEPLNLSTMLYTPDGKPRQSIFYLAHLDDSQRMFFLTLLLEEVVTWTRTQPGTGSLRAIVYVDEVFGYLPPHPLNPPTKRPLMTLLKQGRAFGVGVLVATQNPMDLDYKALSNAGTWFVGKLQTDRDKARLVEGLQGVAAERGTLTDTAYLDAAISSLGNRVFLLHDVHTGRPLTFHTRWALSYLYGPMTRDQIAQVTGPLREQFFAGEGGGPLRKSSAARSCPNCQATAPAAAKFCMNCGAPLPEPAPVPPPTAPAEPGSGGRPALAPAGAPLGNVPPVLPPGLKEFFLPPAAADEAGAAPAGRVLVFEPRLLAFAEVSFSDRRHKLNYRHTYRLLAVPPDAVHPEPWPGALEISDALRTQPPEGEALWADVPESVNAPKKLKELEKAVTEFLYANAARKVLANAPLGLVLAPNEDEDAFRDRCRDEAMRKAEEEAAEAENSTAVEKIRGKWSRKVSKVAEVTLTPRRADIRVTHFGIGWAPFWWVPGEGQTERIPAFEYVELPEGTWRSVPTPEEAAAG